MLTGLLRTFLAYLLCSRMIQCLIWVGTLFAPADDPTKIVTKIGGRYSEYGTIFGSIAFGPVTKINVSVSESDQWRVGGSYLFDFGIVNVSASEQELESGVTQTQYAIGTFVPLAVFGIQSGEWLLFSAAGFCQSNMA